MSRIDHDRDVLRIIDNKRRLKAEELRHARPLAVKAPTLKEQVRNEIQGQLMAIAIRWKETGDVRPAVKSVNQLLLDYPKDLSPENLRRWIDQHFGFDFSETMRAFSYGVKKAKHLDMAALSRRKWWA